MTDLTPIREYEQAVYVYWLGPNLPTVKIGHTNNPARRLEEFRRETGTPGHKASFAAIVWLDRRREAVELAVHRRLRDQRRDGEWFSATDSPASLPRFPIPVESCCLLPEQHWKIDTGQSHPVPASIMRATTLPAAIAPSTA